MVTTSKMVSSSVVSTSSASEDEEITKTRYLFHDKTAFSESI